MATGVAIPLGRLTSDASWRTCLYLQCAPAVINVAFILFICESPRWLYARGRKDEAVAILARYHSKTGDVNSPLIRLQIMEIEESISVDGGDRRFWDFRCLFNSPSNRYRFGLCAMISCWGQLAGNGMITCEYYSVNEQFRFSRLMSRLPACPPWSCRHYRPKPSATAQSGEQLYLHVWCPVW